MIFQQSCILYEKIEKTQNLTNIKNALDWIHDIVDTWIVLNLAFKKVYDDNPRSFKSYKSQSSNIQSSFILFLLCIDFNHHLIATLVFKTSKYHQHSIEGSHKEKDNQIAKYVYRAIDRIEYVANYCICNLILSILIPENK